MKLSSRVGAICSQVQEGKRGLMDIVGDRKFVEIAGDRTHELPPLLVKTHPEVKRLDKIMELASSILESEDLLATEWSDEPSRVLHFERRRYDLAVNLVEKYLGFLTYWHWGDSVLEWIRQCETTFDSRPELRNVLRGDLWPHAGRSSFVTLLGDKSVNTEGVPLDEAVGLRLTFRQPPPISCFSNQFLLLLNGTVGSSAYEKWAHMVPDPISSLPPERFRFDVVSM